MINLNWIILFLQLNQMFIEEADERDENDEK